MGTGFNQEQNPAVTENMIKVWLFAQPAYWQGLSIDVPLRNCVSLSNNLIDGKVQSILVGGATVPEVLKRRDKWVCEFYDEYDCGDDDKLFSTGDGIYSLQSGGWWAKIHGVKCWVGD
ncbi:hypothetical protein K469DRAFT_589910 [Zopfia rhizophila CBS 207.26]|uniref:Uncharacterized protein n=1 Tax=Zopfia rhizophila CBS 207.26 TaxID=1314779 RepID=A0A6A6DP21_9PEZI|nr:hypothetical protein K469DRAFT_589910 [Zopfia rhizophila CBS 207.26]